MDESKIIDFQEYQARRLVALKKAAGEASEAAERLDKRNRVKSGDFVLMITTALFFDALQALLLLIPYLGLVLSSLVGMMAWLTFWFWTTTKGWGVSDSIKQSLLSKKALTGFLVKWLPAIEILPGANIVPVWTLRVFLQLSFLKSEDVLYNTTQGKIDMEQLETLYKKVA